MRISALASKTPSLSAISRLGLRAAFGVALLIGVQYSALAHETSPHESVVRDENQTNFRKYDTVHAVASGEAAVSHAPQDAALRAELGHAYLRAGRFESAAAALRDAVALGDTTDRTTLSLALAQIACGQNRAALATLDRGANIAPAGLGLALALAGDPGRGIAVLTDAVRDGSGSASLRQNLAYAYALDGRWADATLTAGFDLRPDQVNARLQQWAQSMQSGGERMRVAQLLNVPLIADLGMPAALALNHTSTDPAPTPLALAPAAVEVPLPTPAVAVAAPMPAPAAANPGSSAPPAVAAPQPPAAIATPRQPRRVAVRRLSMSHSPAHFVQLAAYHSRHSAERGRLVLAKRHAMLRGRGLLITEAKFNGRSYWRVVMGGFDVASASKFCSSLKRHGAACFAYSMKPRVEGLALALADLPRNR